MEVSWYAAEEARRDGARHASLVVEPLTARHWPVLFWWRTRPDRHWRRASKAMLVVSEKTFLRAEEVLRVRKSIKMDWGH